MEKEVIELENNNELSEEELEKLERKHAKIDKEKKKSF